MRYHPPALPSIEAALRDLVDARTQTRVEAARALGLLTDARSATGALMSALRDQQSDVRAEAALALGERVDVAALDGLLERLAIEAHPLVRQAIVEALGKLAHPGALEAIAELATDECDDVRFQIPAALARMLCSGDDISQTRRQRGHEALMTLVGDTDAEVRGSAAAALGDIGAREPAERAMVSEALAALLEQDDDASVQYEAAMALAVLGDRRGIDPLISALSQREHAASAACELHRWRTDLSTTQLRAIASIPVADEIARVWLAALLASRGDERARQRLERFIRSRHAAIRGLSLQLAHQSATP